MTDDIIESYYVQTNKWLPLHTAQNCFTVS